MVASPMPCPRLRTLPRERPSARPSLGPAQLRLQRPWIALALLALWLGPSCMGSSWMAPDAQAQTTSSGAGASRTTDSSDAGASIAMAGAKGAKTYCYMRSVGNTHKVSWEAAYALIKRQNANLFKTSPGHAAVMITEAVVNDPAAYPDCGKYLGDLYVKE